MIHLNVATRLFEQVFRRVNLPQPSRVLDGWRHIPRPALFGPGWGDFDLDELVAPDLQDITPVQLAYLFESLIDGYFMEGSPIIHVFREVGDSLRLRPDDYSMLFPSRRGPLKHTVEDAVYALGIILFCAHTLGHKLEYGRDFAIVYLQDGKRIGFQDCWTVSPNEEFCIQVPDTDWVQFFEGVREREHNEAPLLHLLHVRARSEVFEDRAGLTRAIQILAHGTRSKRTAFEGRMAEVSGLHKAAGINSYQRRQILRLVEASDSPVRTLESLLVPHFTTSESFSTAASDYRYVEKLMDNEEVVQFVDDTLAKLGLARRKKKTNKKGKTHAHSNHRQGRGG